MGNIDILYKICILLIECKHLFTIIYIHIYFKRYVGAKQRRNLFCQHGLY